MPLKGKYHSETLLATRESLRISLMWVQEKTCVGCQILSLLPIAPCLFLWASATPPHHQSQSSITPRVISQAPCLENKLIFSPSPHAPPQKTSISEGQYLCSRLIIFLVCSHPGIQACGETNTGSLILPSTAKLSAGTHTHTPPYLHTSSFMIMKKFVAVKHLPLIQSC